MKVRILQAKWDNTQKKNIMVGFKLDGCNDIAEVKPHIVKNDDFNRRLQREALGKELPAEWSEPYLEYAPGRTLAWPTAAKLGTIVDAETGLPVECPL